MAGPAGTTTLTRGPRHGFAARRRVAVAALDAVLTEFVHRDTAARHLHLDTDDEDSAFLLAFTTPAPDSTGVTHVLEHVVLCGGERYPSRRAFFGMLGRTLSTTMNAFTTEDCTAFHFSTPSPADFENLLSVYLDAAFFARLDPLDFRQEGCRVEFERSGDPRSPLVRRGVVLNEMKGLMTEPDQQLQQALNQALFPSGPYRFNAGGDPWRIPELTPEALRAYHRRHYHPGNAIFMSAGKVQADWVQRRLEEWALARYPPATGAGDGRAALVGLGPTAVRSAPTRTVIRFPVTGGNGATRAGVEPSPSVAVGWVLGDTADARAVLRAQLLSRCLLEQKAAPLREALERTELGARSLSSGGVQDSRRRLTFHCGLRGCEAENAGALEARVLEVLTRVARDGLAADRLESGIDQMRRELLEREDRRHPHPLKLLARMLPAALYGGDVATAVDPQPALASLRDLVESPRRCADWVRRTLLENASRACVALVPDPEGGERLRAEDRTRLAHQHAAMNDAARERVAADAAALRARQSRAADENEDALPALGLDAIGPAPVAPALQPTTLTGIKVWISAGRTNQLFYARLSIDVPRLEADLVDEVGTYCEALAELGHGGLDVHQTRARIDRVCDRLQVEPRALAVEDGARSDGDRPGRALLLVCGRALQAQHDALATVIADASYHARFDDEAVLHEVLARAFERRAREVTRWGHVYAQRAAAACLDGWAALAERWQGMTSLEGLALGAGGGETLARVRGRLARLRESLATASKQLQLVCDAGSGAAAWDTAPWSRLASAPGSGPPLQTAAPVAGTGTAWLVDSPVSYCARVFPAVTSGHDDAAPLAVLAAHLDGEPLQCAIRERGGAYGAGARYCPRTSTIRFFSYRDPRLGDTLADFDRAAEQAHDRPPSGRCLESAVLRVIRELDRTKAFQSAAMESYLDVLQGRDATRGGPLRAAVLQVEPEQIAAVAARYLQPQRGRTGVLAPAGRTRELEGLGLSINRLRGLARKG